MTEPAADLRPDLTDELTRLLAERILVIDGAMGTAIQRDRPSEATYRGERFADWPQDLQGNNDLLSITAPGDHRGDPPGVPRGRRRHPRDQHLQRQRHLAVRLRHVRPGPRAQPRGRTAGPSRRRRGHRADARQAAVRRRRDRPDLAHGVHLARRQRPRRAQRHLRRARGGLPRRRARPGRGRRRPPGGRDHLRHPQRQGGDLRPRDAVRGARPPLAGHHLGHDHRRLRPHAVRAGDRGVLGVGAARPAARGRAQLRARRDRDAALHRRAQPGRRHVRVVLSQRRPAQRVRGVRRAAARDRGRAEGVRAGRVPQPGRRLLRHDARAHPRDRGRGGRRTPSRGPRGRRRDATLRSRAVHDHRGQPLRERGGAHQHHRLREVPQPDQGRRLRQRPRRRRAAGRERRPGHRRQHGRRA